MSALTISTRVVAVDPMKPDESVMRAAGARVQKGGLVAFPTESFYGLGADALDPAAVARVFEVKGRPDDKPLLVLVDSIAMAADLAAAIPDGARALMARHWPGALTLVLRASARVPAGLTGGTGTVGVRLPGHAVARALVVAAARPVTAPSANPSAAPPPRTAGDVRGYFDGRVELILDGGTTAGGAGSTVADCTVWPPRILRQGPVIIETACG
ncbi:MAG TPA: L-threonylcarbamoyladenylate synthase [Methylomirabilota bacterium]|nr:L-threonylcarbamoyladenylate synthase [Methylomirabilota bacterium]